MHRGTAVLAKVSCHRGARCSNRRSNKQTNKQKEKQQTNNRHGN